MRAELVLVRGLIFLTRSSDGERSGRLDGWAIHALSLQSQHPTSISLFWFLLLHAGTEPVNQRWVSLSAYPVMVYLVSSARAVELSVVECPKSEDSL